VQSLGYRPRLDRTDVESKPLLNENLAAAAVAPGFPVSPDTLISGVRRVAGQRQSKLDFIHCGSLKK
jgi:hypothetical protein